MKTIKQILNYEVNNDAIIAEEQAGFGAELSPQPTETLSTNTKLLLMDIGAYEQLS